MIWGANFSVQKYVLPATTPAGLLLIRYLVMPALAMSLLIYRHGLRLPWMTRADLSELARVAFFGHFVHVGMVTWGIHWSTAFSSALILACGPIFTLLILRWLGVERLRRMQVAGVTVAFTGVIVFLSDKLFSADWRATGGDLFLLVASSFFSYYTVAAKPLIEKHGVVVVTAYGTVLGAIPTVMVAAPLAIGVDWASVDPKVWLALSWSVVISAFVGWLLWGWVNVVRGVARTAPMMYLVPVVAGLVAWLVSDEQFTPAKLTGAGITLLGVGIAQFADAGTPGSPRRPSRQARSSPAWPPRP